MPLADQDEQPAQTRAIGTFSIDSPSFEVSNARDEIEFQVTNNAPVARSFTIEKFQHSATRVSASGQTLLDVVELEDGGIPPLHWASMSLSKGGGEQVTSITVDINPMETASIHVSNLTNMQIPRWTGMLRVSAKDMGEQFVNLSFVSQPDGQWSGTMYYYSQFEDGTLDAWRDKQNSLPSGNPNNAFLLKWARFRQGDISLDEFIALTTSIREETWNSTKTRQDCPSSNGACYPWDGSGTGLVTLTDNQATARIPRGVVDLPIVVNLKTSQGNRLDGKIVTQGTLNYAGDPALVVEFETNPTECSLQTNIDIGGADSGKESHCLTYLSTFQANAIVGGRYIPTLPMPDASGQITQLPNCDQAPRAPGSIEYKLAGVPWLVPGFTAKTMIDPQENLRYRFECRDQAYPFAPEEADKLAINQNFAGSNPIPNASSISRKLELVDGVMIDQRRMLILFKETLDSFLGASDSQGFVAYGYIELTRSAATLTPDDYSGNLVYADTRTSDTEYLDVACSPELVEEALGRATAIDANVATDLVQTLIEGRSSESSGTLITEDSSESVHWLCVDTGYIDGGRDANNPIPCPEGSEIQYFAIDSAQSVELPNLTCQQQSPGTCMQTLNNWVTTGLYGARRDVVWTCKDDTRAVCNDNRFDPVSERDFYQNDGSAPKFLALAAEIDDAFRYKTRFRSRSGSQVGFTPEICIKNSDQRPYCYDPERIEKIVERVDCALDLYTTYSIAPDKRTKIREFLRESVFAYKEFTPAGATLPQKLDGFEFLLGELLVMLGDDAFTLAAASRFDLANSQALGFEGSKFETSGLDLAGAAGYEMYVLYQATQHYQMVLDRFYTLAPRFYKIRGNANLDVIGVAAIESYFLKVLLASTRKAQAWRAIAQRYQNFDRADLARRVIEREYAATYLESVVLSRFLLGIIDNPSPDETSTLDQIRERHTTLQRSYARELREMRTTYNDLTDEINFFGFSPDYIPFPALDPTDVNAFEKVMARAQQLQAVAKSKEDDALAQSRSYNVDQQQFQAELTSIRQNYESELAQICGSFEGDDGAVYPAIAKYAPKSEFTLLVGDPCGLVGNGAIFETMTQVDGIQLRMLDAQKAIENHIASIQITRETVAAQCDARTEVVDVQFAAQQETNALQRAIGNTRNSLNALQRVLETAKTISLLNKCTFIGGTANGGDCPTAMVQVGIFHTLSQTSLMSAAYFENEILRSQSEIANIEANTARWVGIQEACVIPQISAAADVKRQLLELERAKLRVLEEQVNLARILGAIRGLRNQAKRLQADQDETQQLIINVEAAKNDPNVRIYKNDAILTAERTFESTVREAWRATRVYEYYTSQSYAARNDLFLARMISRGSPSVEAYLASLDEAFYEFEETYGNPDVRVAVISVRDDVLNIPEFDESSQPMSLQARVQALRERLVDESYIDERGYRVIPFSTGLSELSPLTRNHKISHVEVEIVGTSVGDGVGRVYLNQLGTGTVSPLVGDKLFYRFPERQAVINPFFNGQRLYEPEIYRSDRLRDRPFANSYWELILDQKDEAENQDIDLQSLTDITLYIYYTDFTSL